jgi:hypothetical protein
MLHHGSAFFPLRGLGSSLALFILLLLPFDRKTDFMCIRLVEFFNSVDVVPLDISLYSSTVDSCRESNFIPTTGFGASPQADTNCNESHQT